jgi:hypothetical protein
MLLKVTPACRLTSRKVTGVAVSPGWSGRFRWAATPVTASSAAQASAPVRGMRAFIEVLPVVAGDPRNVLKTLTIRRWRAARRPRRGGAIRFRLY